MMTVSSTAMVMVVNHGVGLLSATFSNAENSSRARCGGTLPP